MKDSFSNRIKKAMGIRNIKQAELVERTGLPKSAISQYVAGKYEPKQKGIYLIAEVLDVNEAWLMGYDVEMERTTVKYPDNILKIETKKFPMLGTIAAGEPILAEEQFESYVEAGSNIHADFCLKIQGDSMINARICSGDIVFIKTQSVVEDGQIAAVLIGNEATLKRVYCTDHQIILAAENPNFKPLVYKNEELESIRILGRAVAFQSPLV